MKVDVSRRAVRLAAGLGVLIAAAACSVAPAPQAQAQPGGKPVVIELKSLKFKPNKVTVKPGTPVNFVWRETVAHNVVFANKGPKSKTINKGLWAFDTKLLKGPGTYKYKCTLHPGMNGEITIK